MSDMEIREGNIEFRIFIEKEGKVQVYATDLATGAKAEGHAWFKRKIKRAISLAREGIHRQNEKQEKD